MLNEIVIDIVEEQQTTVVEQQTTVEEQQATVEQCSFVQYHYDNYMMIQFAPDFDYDAYYHLTYKEFEQIFYLGVIYKMDFNHHTWRFNTIISDKKLSDKLQKEVYALNIPNVSYICTPIICIEDVRRDKYQHIIYLKRSEQLRNEDKIQTLKNFKNTYMDKYTSVYNRLKECRSIHSE